MEVGAVKQAFNNEVILLKKNLNQAKIQVIHKLTRKAKTLTQKKVPDHVEVKFKRKAESAVNEVLAIKKLKPKDVAKFIVTHTKELKQYLNNPKADQDKACARLLLHKSLQEKYRFIRGRFSNIPIEDLLMSRQERRKLKKEAYDKKKKKGKNSEVVNSEGDRDVLDDEMGDDIKDSDNSDISNDEASSNNEEQTNEDDSNAESGNESDANSEDGKINMLHNDFETDNDNSLNSETVDLKPINDNLNSKADLLLHKKEPEKNDLEAIKNNTNSKAMLKSDVLLHKQKPEKQIEKNDLEAIKIKQIEKNMNSIAMQPDVVQHKQKPEKHREKKDRTKDNKKNKNLNEKLVTRKFKKHSEDILVNATKIVDPFFVTSTGENYMSLAEPKLPDEVKEIHKQGNRKLRRAIMFGHVPKSKARRDGFKADMSNRRNGVEKSNRLNNKFDRQRDARKRGNDRDKNVNDNNKRSNFNDTRLKSIELQDKKPEKLHPSWEAKKKKSGILPFQGKKIVFDS
ncbi:uncharacterized protein LOC106129635 [Amyelois transitella]|uniref:uncharacterized protein LOC106129635 n=1 Tax=Amyelois transitella TaxID=680683 RepID=UPI0029900B9A|nr:uncharacterized protein LOC106129635 [Amyelois transitella]